MTTAPAPEITTVAVEDVAYFMAAELSSTLPMYRLTTTEYDVLHTLLGHMERGGRVYLKLEDIADRLGTAASHISTALTKLRDLGLVWRPTLGQYQVNPRIAFRGTVEEWNQALDEIPDEIPDVIIPTYTRRPPRRRTKPLRVA